MSDLLTLHFDGLDGATTWTEDSQSLSPDTSTNFVLDTDYKQAGTASLYAVDTKDCTLIYTLPSAISGDFTATTYVRFNGLASCTDVSAYTDLIWLDSAGNAEIDFYLSCISSGTWELVFSYTLADSSSGSSSISNPFSDDTWYKLELSWTNSILTFKIDDVEVETWNSLGAGAFIGLNAWEVSTFHTTGTKIWYDESTLTGTEAKPMIVFPSLKTDAHLKVDYNCISASLSLPKVSVKGNLGIYTASLNQKLPAIRGAYATEAENDFTVGWGGGEATLKLPSVTLSATATYSPIASLSSKIPAVALTASAIQDQITGLQKAIGAIKLTASAIQSPVSSLSKKIGAIRISASATAGLNATLEEKIGAVKLDGNSYWLMPASLDTAIPPVALTAVAVSSGNFEMFSFNPKTMGLTKYTNYEFNSMCMFNGKALGAKAAGIYELTGDDDAGDTIIWKIKPGQLDFKTKRLANVFLSGLIKSDIILTVEHADGTSYEYRGEPITDYEEGIKIKAGKGLQTGRGLSDRYLSLEITNETSGDVNIDSIIVNALKVGK